MLILDERRLQSVADFAAELGRLQPLIGLPQRLAQHASAIRQARARAIESGQKFVVLPGNDGILVRTLAENDRQPLGQFALIAGARAVERGDSAQDPGVGLLVVTDRGQAFALQPAQEVADRETVVLMEPGDHQVLHPLGAFRRIGVGGWHGVRKRVQDRIERRLRTTQRVGGKIQQVVDQGGKRDERDI